MRHSRLLNGAAPVLVLVLASAVVGAIRGGFTDLFVYRYGGRAVLEGLPVFGSRDPVTGLRFTYPPFAALVMAPLAVLPARLAAALWTGASVGALAVTVVVVRRALDRPAPGRLVALLTGGALVLEPVWQNLAFGQVNLFLMLAVLVDLVRPGRRWSGVLVGIAAGVKLTPLVFVVLLALVGRRAAAGRAVLAFAGTLAVGFVAMPGSAATYWAHRLVDARRVGPPALAHNQSVYGALTPLFHGPPPTLLWLAVAASLALAVLVVGARWWRRGDRVLGTGLAALAMLIASPISWTHHWVWVAPLALAVWDRSRWAGAVWTAVFVARPGCGRPGGRTASSGAARSTTSPVMPTSSPRSSSPSGQRPNSTAASASPRAPRPRSRRVRARRSPEGRGRGHPASGPRSRGRLPRATSLRECLGREASADARAVP